MLRRVPEILQSCPLQTVRKGACMWKLVHLYSNPLVDGALARYILKKYRGHRMIPEFVGNTLDDMSLEDIRAEMVQKLSD